jgi:transposase-like protein
MVGEEVSMDTRMALAFARRVESQINVTELCAHIGVSRQTFYEYEGRFLGEGLAGLLPRSRAPHQHPNQTPDAMGDAIEAWRTKLAEEGLDHGARSIWARMARAGQDPPHPRTVHRVLVRRGLIEPQPQKRPRSTFKRFAATAPNGIWQIDGMEWKLADGRKQVLVRVLDDHSRKSLGTVVADHEDTAAAWAALTKAMTTHGVPAMFLSDNSLAFNGSRKQRLVLVERNLRDLGVAVVASSARHPQTCGKAEREHQTMQRWLRAHPAAESAAELQRLIDIYDLIYNDERPHQASPKGLMTPSEVYAATPKAGPADHPLPTEPKISQAKVTARGELSVGPLRIQVGRGWEGVQLIAVRDGNSVAIFHRHHLVDHRIIDPTRRYQPNGRKPPGGRRRLPRPTDVLSTK